MWDDVALAIILICGANLFFGSILGFLGYLRYLKHKETIALAENGLLNSVPGQKQTTNPRAVRSAVILIAVGTALCIGLYPIGWIAMPGELPLNLGPWMLAGLIPLFIGIALFVSHYLPSLQFLVGQGVQRALDQAEHDRRPLPESEPLERVQRVERTEHHDEAHNMKV
ncbi:MAG: DUF6249 domain-containing protein [Chloroflexota bacterium]